jgi:hypothetical protein
MLIEKHFIKVKQYPDGSFIYEITVNGYEYLKKIHKYDSDSRKAFIAMWFDKSLDNYYNTIYDVIKKLFFEPIRIDNKEHVNKIDDEIIKEIKKSRFLVADLTGHRGGVYYEIGYAHALEIPVVLSCRKSDFEKIHFDINHYNCLLWDDNMLGEFSNKLINRIQSIL